MFRGRRPGISSAFRSNDRPTHQGVDLMYPRLAHDPGPPGGTQLPTTAPRWYMSAGLPALAYDAGVVTTSKEIGTGGYVVIDHADGLTTQYMHLRNRRVRVGDRVSAGQPIAEAHFNPSAYKLIHLHFQLRKNGVLQNPAAWLAKATIVRDPRSTWLAAAAAVGAGLLAYRFVFR